MVSGIFLFCFQVGEERADEDGVEVAQVQLVPATSAARSPSRARSMMMA